MRLTFEDLKEIAKIFVKELEPEKLSKVHFFGPCIRKFITESNWDPNYDVVYISFSPYVFDFSKIGLKYDICNNYTGTTLGARVKVNGKNIIIKKEVFYGMSRNEMLFFPNEITYPEKTFIGNNIAIPLTFFLENDFDENYFIKLKAHLENEKTTFSMFETADLLKEEFIENIFNLLIDGYFIKKISNPRSMGKDFHLIFKKTNNRECLRNTIISALDSRHFVNVCDIFIKIPLKKSNLTSHETLEDQLYYSWELFTNSLKKLDELYSDRDRVILRTLLYVIHGQDEYSIEDFLGWSLGLKKEYKNLIKNLRYTIFHIYGELVKYKLEKSNINIVARRVFRVLYRKDLFDYYEEYIEPMLHVYYEIPLNILKDIRSIVNTLRIEDIKLPINGEEIANYIEKYQIVIESDDSKDNKNWAIGAVSLYLLDIFDRDPEITKEELLNYIKDIKI